MNYLSVIFAILFLPAAIAILSVINRIVYPLITNITPTIASIIRNRNSRKSTATTTLFLLLGIIISEK